MLKFSDLSVGDYVLWAKQKSNIDGDYDLEFHVKQLNLGDFVFMEENVWNEQDLNEFVKPIEITHDIMSKLGWKSEEVWAGIIQYTFEEYIKDGIDYHGCKFNLKNTIKIETSKRDDFVRKIVFDCFNNKGFLKGEKAKCDEPHYLHELQHLMRECGIEQEIELKEGN